MKKIKFFMGLLIGVSARLLTMEHNESTESIARTEESVSVSALYESMDAHIESPKYKVVLRLSNGTLTMHLDKTFTCTSVQKERPKSQLMPSRSEIRKSRRLRKPTQRYAAFLALCKEKNK